MSERCERTSEWRSEWPSTLRVDFIVFYPTVQWCKMEKTVSKWYAMRKPVKQATLYICSYMELRLFYSRPNPISKNINIYSPSLSKCAMRSLDPLLFVLFRNCLHTWISNNTMSSVIIQTYILMKANKMPSFWIFFYVNEFHSWRIFVILRQKYDSYPIFGIFSKME